MKIKSSGRNNDDPRRTMIEQLFLDGQIIDYSTPDNNIDKNPLLPDKFTSTDVIPSMDSYDSANRTFKYLDDDILSSNITLFPRNLTESYTIHLCLFSINTDLQTPFLEFMFSKEDALYTFPHGELDMKAMQETASLTKIQPTIENDDGDDSSIEESNQVDVEFLTQCGEIFNKTISIPDVDMQSRYRGFLEDEELTNQLYVFFDCTGLNIHIKEEKFRTGEYTMAIVDELNNGRINDIEIEPNILQIFNNNPFTMVINTYNGVSVPIPIIAYMCSQTDDDNTYVNEYYNDNADNEYGTLNLIYPMVTHAKFGDIYMFTKVPLNGDYNRVKRFAVFYDKVTDEEDQGEEGEEESSEEGEEDSNIELDENVVFTFQDNNQTYYGTYSFETFTQL